MVAVSIESTRQHERKKDKNKRTTRTRLFHHNHIYLMNVCSFIVSRHSKYKSHCYTIYTLLLCIFIGDWFTFIFTKIFCKKHQDYLQTPKNMSLESPKTLYIRNRFQYFEFLSETRCQSFTHIGRLLRKRHYHLHKTIYKPLKAIGNLIGIPKMTVWCNCIKSHGKCK